jgi:hypothetical protein
MTLVHCYCKKCGGVLRDKRTEQRHRAAAKELAGDPQHLGSKFTDWKNSNGRVSNERRGSHSTGSGETESDSSESDSSDSDSDSEERPAKRLRLLAQMV